MIKKEEMQLWHKKRISKKRKTKRNRKEKHQKYFDKQQQIENHRPTFKMMKKNKVLLSLPCFFYTF